MKLSRIDLAYLIVYIACLIVLYFDLFIWRP